MVNDNREAITIHLQGRGYDLIYRIEDDEDVQLIVRIIDRLRVIHSHSGDGGRDG